MQKTGGFEESPRWKMKHQIGKLTASQYKTIVYNESGEVIAITPPKYCDLFAAAPDMLEVLEAVEWKYYSHRMKTCPCCDWAQDRNHAPDCKLAAALKKARGEK